jgi:hypothetical protein
MVAFLFLFAPVLVLIAVWTIQWFQPARDRVPESLKEHRFERGRIEPRFSTANNIAERGPGREDILG